MAGRVPEGHPSGHGEYSLVKPQLASFGWPYCCLLGRSDEHAPGRHQKVVLPELRNRAASRVIIRCIQGNWPYRDRLLGCMKPYGTHAWCYRICYAARNTPLLKVLVLRSFTKKIVVPLIPYKVLAPMLSFFSCAADSVVRV